VFAQAFVLTEGGCGYATTTLVYYIYEFAFQFSKMGYAAAMARIPFAIVSVLTVIQLRVQARWVHDD